MTARARVDIINKRGLHARASAKFVKTANGFDAENRVAKARAAGDSLFNRGS